MEQLKQYHPQKVPHNNIENLNIHHTYHNYPVHQDRIATTDDDIERSDSFDIDNIQPIIVPLNDH